MYHVYVLRSTTHDTRYIGSTADIPKRLKEHNTGKCSYTSGRRPWELLYCEDYATRSEAMQRENFLKSGKGRELLNNLLQSEVV